MMIGVSCGKCLSPWLASIDALNRRPYCPFCGSTRINYKPQNQNDPPEAGRSRNQPPGLCSGQAES